MKLTDQDRTTIRTMLQKLMTGNLSFGDFITDLESDVQGAPFTAQQIEAAAKAGWTYVTTMPGRESVQKWSDLPAMHRAEWYDVARAGLEAVLNVPRLRRYE